MGGPCDWEIQTKGECSGKGNLQTFAQAGRTSPVNGAALNSAPITQA